MQGTRKVCQEKYLPVPEIKLGLQFGKTKQLQFFLGAQEDLLALSLSFHYSYADPHKFLPIQGPTSKPKFLPHLCPLLCSVQPLSNNLCPEKHSLCGLLVMYHSCSECQERTLSYILQIIPPCNLLHRNILKELFLKINQLTSQANSDSYTNPKQLTYCKCAFLL